MSFITPFDLVIAAVFATRRLGLARSVLAGLLLLPVYMWTLPPVPCGCFPPLFRRCDYEIRYFAAIKSDLKNLASQEEIHFAEHGTYSNDWRELGFTHSDGVEVTIFASQDAWAAVATHAAVEDEAGCAIYIGETPVYETGLIGQGPSGEVVCSK